MKRLLWLAFLLPLVLHAGMTGGVTQILAGTNVTISPTDGTGAVTINSSGGGGGSGTVTSVGFTGGIISVATPTTTPALTVAGTSGGVPYFSGSSTWASSGALAVNALVVGGGAGSAPATVTTGTGVLTALGVNNGTAGAFQVNNASGAGLTALTAANISSGALANGMTASTQSAADNSTKLATTAYADAAVAAGVTASSTTTFTNKRITPRVVTESDATTWTPAGDTSDVSYQANTQSTGTLTMGSPSGTPVNGQRILLKIKSTNVQTYSWNAIYVSGTTVTLPTASTGSSKIDNIGFIYDTVNSKWECVGVAAGY